MKNTKTQKGMEGYLIIIISIHLCLKTTTKDTILNEFIIIPYRNS